jgi:hypothetical protein
MFAGKFVPSGNETDGTGMHSPTGTDLAITTSGINRVYVDVSGNVGLSSLAPSCALDVNFNDAVLIPRGTTAQRPIGSQGMMRFNTDFSTVEFFDGSVWRLLNESLIATGGSEFDQVISGINFRFHVFDSVGSDTFTVLAGVGNIDYLIVGGGGGGGGSTAGGGGAGGLLQGTLSVTTSNYPIVVGGGGVGARKSDDGLPNLNYNSSKRDVISEEQYRVNQCVFSKQQDNAAHV